MNKESTKYAMASIDDNSNDSDSSEASEFSSISSSNCSSGSKSTERCPICLNKFKDQDIAIPSSCEHEFCLECLEEWSKVINSQIFKLCYNNSIKKSRIQIHVRLIEKFLKISKR